MASFIVLAVSLLLLAAAGLTLWRYRELFKPGPKELFGHDEPRQLAAALTDNPSERERITLELLLIDTDLGLSQYPAARQLRSDYLAGVITAQRYYAELRAIHELCAVIDPRLEHPDDARHEGR